MVNAESSNSEARQQHAHGPIAAQASGENSVRLGLDGLLHYSHDGPLICGLFPNQRRFERLVIPHVVAYVGGAHASRPHRVANISVGGFCMLTEESWTQGSAMSITLQREEWDGEESSECISVQAIVTRHGCGEAGFSITLTPEEFIAFSVNAASGRWISKTRMEEFLEKLKKPKPRRPFLIDFPRERPLAFAERTELLLEIAKRYSRLPASGLLYGPNYMCAVASEKSPQGKRKRKRQKNRSKGGNDGKASSVSDGRPKGSILPNRRGLGLREEF